MKEGTKFLLQPVKLLIQLDCSGKKKYSLTGLHSF